MLPEESAPSAPAQQNVSKSNLNWWNKSNSATLFHQGEKRVVSRCSKDHNVRLDKIGELYVCMLCRSDGPAKMQSHFAAAAAVW